MRFPYEDKQIIISSACVRWEVNVLHLIQKQHLRYVHCRTIEIFLFIYRAQGRIYAGNYIYIFFNIFELN